MYQSDSFLHVMFAVDFACQTKVNCIVCHVGTLKQEQGLRPAHQVTLWVYMFASLQICVFLLGMSMQVSSFDAVLRNQLLMQIHIKHTMTSFSPLTCGPYDKLTKVS